MHSRHSLVSAHPALLLASYWCVLITCAVIAVTAGLAAIAIALVLATGVPIYLYTARNAMRIPAVPRVANEGVSLDVVAFPLRRREGIGTRQAHVAYDVRSQRRKAG